MIELASDLLRIRRYASPIAWRYRVELDDLVSETACEILGRYRRNPDLRVPAGPMLRHATREALRRVARGCHVPRRAHGFDIARLAAPSPKPEDVAPPSRPCSSCGGEFVPVRRDARYCSRVECARARAAERQRRRKARGGKAVGRIPEAISGARIV